MAYLNEIDRQVDQLLNAGLITPCNSAWASNLVLVRKRWQPGEPVKFGITLDLRKLNERLHRLAFPMPSSNLVLDSLRDKKFYSVLNLANAYLSVPLNPETNHLTACVGECIHFLGL